MASGVPIVVPDHGAFSELIADTGGGLLHEPHNGTDLAMNLAELLLDPEKGKQLGKAGQLAVRDRYHDQAMARRTLTLYQQLASQDTG